VSNSGREKRLRISSRCSGAFRTSSPRFSRSLPVFRTIARLHVIARTPDILATYGAVVFLAARTLCVPAYLFGVRGVRSAIWVASWVGLAMMIAAQRW
jgi:uncharacterized MAPEG superfamily protein